MPNTPAMVGEGMTALCGCSKTSNEELQLICNIFSSFGKCEIVPEKLVTTIQEIRNSGKEVVLV